ncbi:carbon monoxide dehydrogenase [Pigmentiphaga sp. H8]|uniref:FAD binding domain-containing protein n=1 Tax=unclassified Pigmentiphaga TaxID=2626614 RepID=UPI000F595931|nr:FAD binding domain-containing protein [Pigmentiphaga sp. H8]AZG11444.1 carbon monoxide dehydrogenase [Pigmentiphaga sp. H8]
MKPCAFDYVRPADLASALDTLSAGADVRPMAGGQSLVPVLSMRLARPARVMDVSRLRELQAGGRQGDVLELGAAVTHARIEDGIAASFAQGYLTHVAGGIAYRAVRNRGTVGGSLAHADPIADWPVALLAAGASVVAASAAGRRELPLETFADGPFSHTLREDELLVSIRLPWRSEATRWAYAKLARKAGEFAQAIAAIVIDRPAGYARVAVAGAGGTPMLLPALAERLLRGELRGFDLAQAGQALRGGGAQADDLHAAAVALRRTVQELS